MRGYSLPVYHGERITKLSYAVLLLEQSQIAVIAILLVIYSIKNIEVNFTKNIKIILKQTLAYMQLFVLINKITRKKTEMRIRTLRR